MNIFDLPPLPLQEELATILAQNPNARIERIVSTGQTSDWYAQEETEFVVLLEGNAKIEFEDRPPAALHKGDCIIILPHECHRVRYTSTEPPCMWLCVFY